MQTSIQRAVRGSALLVLALASGTGVASAASIRQGTTTAYPTSASPLVASGTAVGGPLSSAANFSLPIGTGSCTGGALRATVGANPASPVNLATSTSPSALRVDTCTDNLPSWDLFRFEMTNAPVLTAVNTSGGGTLTLPSTVRFQLVFSNAGTFTPCGVVPIGPSPVVGAITNGNARVTFSNLRVRSTSSTSVCATNIGTSNTGTTGNSVFSFSFGLRTIPTSGTGNLLGIFA